MVAIEIKLGDGFVKVRRFGTGEFNRWGVVNPGGVDNVTGWPYEELRRLGDGVWDFGRVVSMPALSNAHAFA